MSKKEYKIAQISDLHLGYSSGKKRINELGYNVRENDAYVAYNKAVEQMIEEKVDCVLVTGDFFHSPRPKNHTIIIAQEGLRKLAKENIPVYILAGNHDATDVRAEIPSSKILDEPNSNLHSYCEPYVVKEIFPNLYVHFLSHHAFTEQENTISQIKLKENAVNILASHGSTYDTNLGCILHSPQEPREVIIPQELMDLDWTYTLLGHIHERGWIGSKNGKTDTAKRKQFYGGSLIRRGFADKECKLGRGWTLWTVNTDTHKMTPTMFTIKERPQFDLPNISVKDKTAVEIENEIIEQLKTVRENLLNENNEISEEDMPIVRQTLVNVNSMTSLSVNWSLFNPYLNDFLMHSFRKLPEQTVEESKQSELNHIHNKDIVEVFMDWGKDKDIKHNTLEYMKEILRESRDTELIETEE